MVRRIFALAALFALVLQAASFRLYLKDGNYHVVREYSVNGDRVRYYSVERGDWEEIPLRLVDVTRTEAEVKERAEREKQDSRAFDEEEKAEREQRRELERIPYEPGVYQAAGEEVKALKQAEAKAVNKKGRSILKAVTPIPIVSGKSIVEIPGLRSEYVVSSDRPEFYFRLANDERFGIARLKPTKTGRAVQTWTVVPVTNEIIEETELVEVFKQQLVEGLYKLWPTKPLPPGEYAVFEYTEGAGNIQIWDFSVPGATAPAPAKK